MTLVEKVKSTIDKFSMLSGGEKILFGLSGGPDSVCLLHILIKINRETKLNAIYIDHGLRPDETPSEIEFCSKLCKKLKIPFQNKEINLNILPSDSSNNKQNILRDIRYRIYEEASNEIGASKIALGHNKDDQAETVILNLLRGSGPLGLSGIPPVRDKIIRPLINTSRTEIETYLKENDINFIIDSSNLKQDYMRNQIRLSLIPVLKHYNQNIINTLSRTADIFREENEFLEKEVTKRLIKLISRKTEQKIELFLIPLLSMEKVILRRVLLHAIKSVKGLRGIGFIHIEDIIDLIRNANTGDRVYLSKDRRVIKGYSTLIITSEPPVKIGKYILNIPGEVIIEEANVLLRATILDCFKKTEKNTEICIDPNKIKTSLIVRARAAGDYFYPSGFGKRKKVKKYFIDEKIPRDERNSIPIIFFDNDLVWIAGYRADERFKVSKNTKKCVKLELKYLKA